MMKRLRPWMLALTLAVGLSLAAQGSAQASTTGETQSAAAYAVTASHSGGVAGLTTCAATRSQRDAIAVRGHTRAMCITQGTAKTTGLSAQARTAGTFCSINRFEICTNSNSTISVVNLSNRQVVGQLSYNLQQDIAMNPNSLTFGENYSMTFTGGWGNILGMTVGLTVTCGPDCTATTQFPNPAPAYVGGSFGGAISYTDFPVLIDNTRSTYTLTASGPGAPGTGTSQSQPYRCDTVAGITGGCVNPGYWPTLTTMVNLPTIAQNIRNVQSAGPHHYGRISGGYPLIRNDSLQAANNAAACPPPGAQPPNTSCDEYPFASTSQGAAQSQKPDWNSVWAPVSEQNSQGGYISSFYQGNRVLDGDAFWVQV